MALAGEDGASTNAQGEPVAHAGVVIAARDEIVVELEVMDVTGGAAVTKLEMQDLHTVAGSDKPEKAGSLLLDPDELQLAGFRIGPPWLACLPRERSMSLRRLGLHVSRSWGPPWRPGRAGAHRFRGRS